MGTLPFKPLAILGIVREVKAAAVDLEPILLAGVEGPVRELADALGEGSDEGALRELRGRAPSATDLDEASLLVYAIEGETASGHDEQVLRLASRKSVPALVVLIGRGAGDGDVPDLPYVLATDVLPVRTGEPLPVEEIIERIAARAGDKSYALAAKLPRLRKAVCEEIVMSFSKRNGILGAVIFIPGADLPALTLNQIRMVFRIAGAYGADIDRERAVELLGVLGAGLGFRAVARQLLGVVPGLGWALKGAIAYAGTRALGEAAIRYFEAGGIGAIAGSVRSRS
ncbi:MAG TPA: DUF697 domain-containing protein [Gaiellaceae bacterium]|nr:DUF697 domain-containing protein [Gaiellaceae bacterium]